MAAGNRKGLDGRWLKGITETKEKNKRREFLVGHREFADELREVLDKEINGIRTVQEGRQNITEENWALRQAFAVGRINAMKEIYNLIDFNLEK